VREHQQEYPILTAAVTAVARQEGVSRESVQRWLAQAEVEDGIRPGVTSEESAEVKRLKAENKRLREDGEILRRAPIFFAGELDSRTADLRLHRRDESRRVCSRVDPPGPAPAGPEDRCTHLPGVEEGAPDRGPHGHRRPGPGQDPRTGRTFNPATGRLQMTPEGLYGRRKWVAVLRRQNGFAGTSHGAVDQAMRSLGLEGVRRAKKLRNTIPDPDGKPAGDLLNRDFTAAAPNRV